MRVAEMQPVPLEPVANAAGAPPTSAADADRARKQELLEAFHQFEKSFKQRFPAVWWGTLIGPWIVTVVVAGLIYLLGGARYFWQMLTAAAVAFFFAGRFVIPLDAMANLKGLDLLEPWHMFWMVTYQDVMVALFMAFHVGFLFKLPKIGPKIAELTVDGEMILSLQPWMRKATFFGLIAFIAFPLAATGSVGGAIFGRLLGLSRWATFWGSVIGAVIGNGAMLYLSRIMLALFPENSLLVKLGGPAIIVLLIVWLERRYRAMKRQFLELRELHAGEQSSRSRGEDAA